jgi:signal transduction histidine kinase
MDPQEATIATAILISSVILGIIIIFFIVSIIRQQRRNLELSRQNILAEIAAMEKERARLAADLHDDLGPLLSVIKFQIDTVDAVHIEGGEQLRAASSQLDHLMDRMRAISYNLMPATLKRKGLVTSVNEFLGKIEDSTPLTTVFQHDQVPELSEEAAVNIYRIVQEVVHNVVKHAGTTEVTVKLEQKKDQLLLLIIDNGQGFDYESTLSNGSGLGLRSLKSRTDVLGGTLRVESKKGKGTAFLFTIPVMNQH